ncbi:histidine kinase dimerization/phospho-acceptor domain-containing protein [Pedobacter alluvionis]|uniref:histidine kinase dimerization/phospho-acceptor domain-containing protein n=1 Tax=Pedobacter alluvionis TaxID=475253 RepID=UPI0021CE295E|nr:histidine kinase dimerization/phospho-acceptor domain-containing protein [Pedobacter alluvionis]
MSSFKRLEESQKRLNLALKYTSTAIWELDLDTHEVFRSRDHDEIFGYPQRQEHWSLESYYEHISASDLPAFKEALSNIEAEGGLDVQVRLNRSDGILQWLNIKGKTETGKDGKAVKLIGVINDITNDKIIERHKDDFISIASHELKTPVTSLKGSVQMLQRDANRQSERTRRILIGFTG